ncbi:MAG: DUF1361 domain-containing protein [Patescibacteria group bacterium]
MNNSLDWADILYAKYQGLDWLTINDFDLLAMLWNVLLIAIPWAIAIWLGYLWKRTKFVKLLDKFFAMILGFFWLLFIPNSIYIITDIRHLLNYCPSDSSNQICVNSAWMIPWFFLYAVVGWIFFVYLLRQMTILLKHIFDITVAKLFIILIMPFISLGVLLGLINRWNSWDFFFHPFEVIKSSLIYCFDLRYFIDWFSFTVVLYVLYFLGKTLFKNKLTD